MARDWPAADVGPLHELVDDHRKHDRDGARCG
jgi:hypothetical protein